jgi:curved DNA-binding protein CbpA
MSESERNPRRPSFSDNPSVLKPTDCLEHVREPRPPRGSLASWNMAELLHALRVERASGVLQVARPPIQKLIYFVRGLPVRVDSDLRSETLGAFLRRRGRISEETLQEVLEEMRLTGQRQGELLIEAGVISPRELYEVLSAHMAEKIASCFAWDDGVYSFEQGSHLPGQMVTFDLQPGRIVLDGVVLHLSGTRLDALFPVPDTARPYLREDPQYSPARIPLNPREIDVYRLSSERATITEILETAGCDRDKGRRIYYALYLMELVGFELGEPTRTSLPPDLGDVARVSESPGIGEIDIDASEKLIADYLRLMDADYFALLGLTRDAGEEQVTTAFDQLLPRFDRSNLARMTPVAQHKGIELTERLFEAYRVLIDPDQRAWYVRRLEGREDEEPCEPISCSLHTETLFAASIEAIGVGQPEIAVTALHDALDLKLGEPQYEAWLGWALFVQDPLGNEELARRHIEVAQATLPELPEPFLFLARMAEFEGRDDEAEDLYSEAASRAAWDAAIVRESEEFVERLARGTTRKRTAHQGGTGDADLSAVVWKLFHGRSR